MSKEDYREKFRKSPDLADTIAILMEVARQRGFKISPVGQTIHRFADWNNQCSSCQEVYASDSFYAPDNESELIDMDG